MKARKLTIIFSALLIMASPEAFAWKSHLMTSQTVMSWEIQPSSSIRISGSSNVNSFGCEIIGGFRSQPIQSRHHAESTTSMKATMKGLVMVEVDKFDCKNKLITNDLRKTLRSDEFPMMTIHFLELERLPDVDSEVDFLSGRVLIVLAGQQRHFYLRFAFSKTPEGYLLKGSRAFTFSDFDLSPPSKAGGLIKVRDDFDVGFSLVLKNM